jgi:PAS domain S-box-containing protein
MNGSDAGLNEEEVLRLVVSGTSAETGADFFRALVRNLALALGTLGAWATEYLPQERKLRALGMWLGDHHVDHYEYALEGTACQAVVEKRQLVHIPERLIELFPQDTDLVPLAAVSYLGMPMLDTDGTVMGHISVLDDKPMPRDARAIALFNVFAARAAAELRRMRVEAELRGREEQMAMLLESALDAILVLDSRQVIARVNPAAERLFGCTAEDLLGEQMTDYLTESSAAQLETFCREPGGHPEGRHQWWIPRDFIARRWDHTVFPAEITLARFETRDGICHSLILRNADERLEAERRIRMLTEETEYLREMVRDAPGSGELVGRSDCMQAVRDAIDQVAAADATVLVLGETGTGKELVARSIHRLSPRADKPLVLVNCAAIPATLIESEFFGHEKGAFTGAVQRREGRFAMADGGSIFLDEIGELPLELQAKLLRVVQEGEFEPLGGNRTLKVDVRVVAATHRDLRQRVAEGLFREDLFFRLNVFPITIPPLRQRGRDIELLAAAFTQRFARRLGKAIEPPGPDLCRLLHGYAWPGNVRELQNVIERAVILTSGHELALARAMSGIAEPSAETEAHPATGPRVLTAAEMTALESANLRRALDICGWKVSGADGAARLLGMPPSTLTSRIKSLGIRRDA